MQYKFTMMPVSEEDGGGFYAEVPDLPGCVAAGDTVEETLSILEEAVASWIMVAKDKGKTIPEPTLYTDDKLPSGRFSVRLARSIHKQLLQLAEKEHESLNCTVTRLLEQGLMLKSMDETMREIAYKNFAQEKMALKKKGVYPLASEVLAQYKVCEEQADYGTKEE